jgi:hypothetical protein
MKYRQKQSGVALVITLIMLSVITIITVAFLALSQRERAAVSTTLTGTEAELAANAGHERAKAEILANIREFVNAYTNRQTIGPDLFVSRAEPYYGNFNAANFNANDLLTVANYHSELTNLFYDPAPPVFSTNNPIGRFEQVHYLDLNRNGRFESNGIVRLLDNSGNPLGNDTNYVVGDPQWIGVTARPNELHSSSNRFVYRYAYLVAPAGRTLDIDFIHNRALDLNGRMVFNRNQGHGTWEINLAAFLADLNTNFWNPPGLGAYVYNQNQRTGTGFNDATNFLFYRYARGDLRRASEILPASTLTEWQDDGVDQFADFTDFGVARPWAGASNPQHFFSVHDWFNTPEIANFTTPPSFTNRLRTASIRRSTYDAHTFYRMLAQIGTDSAPERMQVRRYQTPPSGRASGDFIDNARINLNYNNHGTNDVSGNFTAVTADQFINWTPEAFFHVTADRLLRDHRIFINNNPLTPLSVTNLPVYPTNYYTPAVHRILQMTLNIYDTTTNQGPRYPYYPTALKPIFANENNGEFVKIVRYERVPQGEWAITNMLNWKDLSNATHRASLTSSGLQAPQYVYGVPVLLGAKKGFPNFNEYVFQSVVQVERKVNIDDTANGVFTNEYYHIGISNVIGLEAWNPYTNAYPRDLLLVAGMESQAVLTNNENYVFSTNLFVAFSTNWLAANSWGSNQFRIPLGVAPQDVFGRSWAVDRFLPYSVYNTRDRRFVPTNALASARNNNVFAVPQWTFTSTNRVRFFLFDNGNLVDAVGLAPYTSSVNITEALHRMSEDPANNPTAGVQVENYWLTNRVQGAPPTQRSVRTVGLQNQIDRSLRGSPIWGGDAALTEIQRDGFRAFVDAFRTNSAATNNVDVPFTPQQKIYLNFVWQANDPLVHHLAEDLSPTNARPQFSPVATPVVDLTNFVGRINEVYAPWGGGPDVDTSQRPDLFARNLKDPNVKKVDDWDFPTNRFAPFASIGMLGRVHRGTPWQSVYWKAESTNDIEWAKVHRGGRWSKPTNDWRLADIFTVAQHPNASRGRLSVNQTNVAAWSAVLSEVDLRTIQNPNVLTTNVQPVAIDPNRTIERLVEAINFHRKTMTGEVFSSLSEFLGVPELTSHSPFLNTPIAVNPPGMATTPLRDKDFEAIPEKILSLLHRGEPRFVIYAFGQSLKPAPQSILTGGPYRGLVTNYEVSGELASRAVVRIEFDNNRRPFAVVESYNILPPD